MGITMTGLRGEGGTRWGTWGGYMGWILGEGGYTGRTLGDRRYTGGILEGVLNSLNNLAKLIENSS